MISTWQAVFEEDPYSRGYIYLQRGDDEDTRELFEFLPSELVEAPDLSRLLEEMMAPAREEAARRNVNDERETISRSIG
jgi:hypothetical protein